MSRVLLACRVSAFLVLVGTLPTESWAFQADEADPQRLTVRLATVESLPAEAHAALVAEVSRIWTRSGVEVAWTPPGGSVPTNDAVSVRVLVVSRRAPGTRAEHTWPVAELVPGADGHPVAVASLEAAGLVLRVTGHTGEPESLVRRRLGVVLGRAVAHEIGHALLGPNHDRHGLMRARIDAAEFADLRDGGFGFDRAGAAAARAALAARSGRRLATAQ